MLCPEISKLQETYSFFFAGFTLFLIFALIRNFSRASLLLQAWIVVVVFAIIDWIHSKFALSLVICCLPLKVLCITKQIWFKR